MTTRLGFQVPALFTLLAALATGCSVEVRDGSDPAKGPSTSSSGGSGTVPTNTCTTDLRRSGTVAGASVDFPSKPDTTWFNVSLEEVALNAIDKAMMEEAGLDTNDAADVRRFRYFSSGFDLRLLVGETPSPGNWFGKSDLGVYVFDLARSSTAPDATSIAVFDASAVRDARRSGDKALLGKTIRATVDAMKADPRPKAILAFAPDRNPESSVERAFINLFARDVHFATTGTVTIGNLRDATGASLGGARYPLRGVKTVDVSARGEMAGSTVTVGGSCLELVISG